MEKKLMECFTNNDLYIIEKIISKNKDRYLIKWKNYSDKYNSYVDKNDIAKYL